MNPGTVLEDRYELVELIGQGGMAIVYRARDRRTGHFVAVKYLRPEFRENPEFLERFRREAIAASKMSHHNIVNLLDVGNDPENPYIVIEYVNGKTLKDIIREQKRIQQNVAGQIAIRILSALQHAHAANIVHRDIKPQNILVDQDGYIKVSDFGIARMLDHTAHTEPDGEKSVLGSVHYFSPEQASGGTARVTSDIYSVGVVLYEMLTGEVPFQGQADAVIAMQHVQVRPKPPRGIVPDLSPSLEAVVLKALEKDPDDRYHTALEMAQAIKLALQNPERENTMDVPVMKPEAVRKRPPAARVRKRWGRAGVALLGVVLMAGLVVGTILLYTNIVNTTRAPYLLGETEQDAMRLARQAGLVPEIVRQSGTAPAGTVMLQSHDFDYPMRRGAVILITVSTGPVQQAVPKLVGMSEQDALAEMTRIGLTLLVTERVIDTEEAGTILTQEPAQGKVLEYGGIVQVVVSGGRVVVPLVEGLRREEALTILRTAGLNVSKIDEIAVADVAQADRVADQLPDPDTVVMAQTEVMLAIYVVPPATPEATKTP